MSFHENSTTDSHDIDHNTTDGDASVPDTIADAEGADNRKAQQAQEKRGTPPWILDRFEWRSTVDQGTGEERWFMVVRPSAVEHLITNAPLRLDAAIAEFVKHEDTTSAEDFALVAALNSDLTSLVETCSAVDSGYLAERFIGVVVDQITQNAVRIQRWKDTVDSFMQNQKEQTETPDWIINVMSMAAESRRRMAILYNVGLSIKPDMKLNFKAAAWNIMRMEANRNTQNYLDPASERRSRENESSATSAITARW